MASIEAEAGGVTGGAELKSSQAYPDMYGDAVGAMFHKCRQEVDSLSDSCSDDDDDDEYAPTDAWLDSGLQTLAVWANVPTDRLVG